MSFGPFDYGKFAVKLAEELRKLEILAEKESVTVPAGQSVYLPDEGGVDVSEYKFKTISFYADYALNFIVEVSDDGTFTDYPQYYPSSGSESLTANQLETLSFEEDFKYVRVKVSNPDTSDHIINQFRIKGRRL